MVEVEEGLAAIHNLNRSCHYPNRGRLGVQVACGVVLDVPCHTHASPLDDLDVLVDGEVIVLSHDDIEGAPLGIAEDSLPYHSLDAVVDGAPFHSLGVGAAVGGVPFHNLGVHMGVLDGDEPLGDVVILDDQVGGVGLNAS